jgi:metal-dependent HD superfamily phosphatase/phosphodiesterase
MQKPLVIEVILGVAGKLFRVSEVLKGKFLLSAG